MITPELISFFTILFDEQQAQLVHFTWLFTLGAHTLGRANRNFSGFTGPWTRRVNRFDNSFYRELNNVDQWHVVRFHERDIT